MQRRSAVNIDALAQEVSRLLADIDDTVALEDPHRLLLHLAATVETEWEGRARRFRVERGTDALPAPSAPASSSIRAAVLALQQRDRELLLLHLDGLTYRQIAVRKGLPNGVVLRSLTRVYCQLRLHLPEADLYDIDELQVFDKQESP